MGSSEVPQEFADFQVMRAMGWTFEDLQVTPPYVRQMVADFLSMEQAAEENSRPPQTHTDI